MIELTDNIIDVAEFDVPSHTNRYLINISPDDAGNGIYFSQEQAAEIKQQILKCQEDSKKLEKILQLIHRDEYMDSGLEEKDRFVSVSNLEKILNEDSEVKK